MPHFRRTHLFALLQVLGWFVLNGHLAAHAQAPPLQQPWTYYYGDPVRWERTYGAQRLSPHRFVSVGYRDTVFANGAQDPFPLLTFTDENGLRIGEKLERRRVSSFLDVTSADALGAFYTIEQAPDSAGTGRIAHPISLYDSTGTLRWRRYVDDVLAFGDARLLPLPGGVLALTAQYAPLTGAPNCWRAEFARLSTTGRLRWQHHYGRFAYDCAAAPLPDGSYVVVTSDPGAVPRPRLRRRDFDLRLIKVTVAGDSLTSRFLPDSGRHYDWAQQVLPTQDGGLAILGYYEPDTTTSSLSRTMLIKLDSAWQEQWRYVFPPYTGYGHLQELPTGHFLLLGAGRSFLAELAPPTTPGDTTGQLRWVYSRPSWPQPGAMVPRAWVYEASGTAYLFGQGDQTNGTSPQGYNADAAVSLLTGLPAPLPLSATLCQRPPVLLDSATFTVLGTRADSLLFSLDSLTTLAGPRYGEVSLVTWDFGDGSPPQDGWQVTHVFQQPDPVRVRVCAANNLGCRTCQELFPFGVPQPTGVRAAAWAAGVQVYPNPSPDGHFTVQWPQAEAVTLTVRDAVGRVVLAQAGSGGQAGLDLRALSAGVYALHLRTADGRGGVRRLVR